MTITPLTPPTPAPVRGGTSPTGSEPGFDALVEHHLAAAGGVDEAGRGPATDGRTTGGRTDLSRATSAEEQAILSEDVPATGPVHRPPGVAGPQQTDGDPDPVTDAPDELSGQIAAATGFPAEAGTAPVASGRRQPGAVAGGARERGTAAGALDGAASSMQSPTTTATGGLTGAAGTPVTGGDGAAVAATGTAAAPPPATPRAAGQDTTVLPGQVAPGAPVTSEGVDAVPATASAKVPAPPGGTGARDADGSGAVREGEPLPAGAGSNALVGTGPTASTAQATTRVEGNAPVVHGNAVTAQVFDQVTRLVSRGDGTHRLMLRLHPADLGEVKVVLTVRNNTVDVTLSAGAAARDALREGSPQLRSLLELAGATAGQVVVRDHAHAAATAGPAGWGAGQQGAGHGSQPGSAGQQTPAGTGEPLGGDGRHGSGRDDAHAGSGASHGSTGGSQAVSATARRTTTDPAPTPARVGAARLDLDL